MVPLVMAYAARSIRFVPIVLDTNGMLREALRLHSITMACPFLTRNWMLNGPRILRLLAILLEYDRSFLLTVAVIERVGIVIVASPEWTPAFSTCSITAPMKTLEPSQTPSTSTSLAPVRNFEMTTGFFRETRAASRM